MANQNVTRLATRLPNDLRLDIPELPPLPESVTKRLPELAKWMDQMNAWRAQIRLSGVVQT